MRIGIADEVQEEKRIAALLDAHALDAERDQHRPQSVSQLRRQEEDEKRHVRRGTLAREPQREVADEHRAWRVLYTPCPYPGSSFGCESSGGGAAWRISGRGTGGSSTVVGFGCVVVWVVIAISPLKNQKGH